MKWVTSSGQPLFSSISPGGRSSVFFLCPLTFSQHLIPGKMAALQWLAWRSAQGMWFIRRTQPHTLQTDIFGRMLDASSGHRCDVKRGPIMRPNACAVCTGDCNTGLRAHAGPDSDLLSTLVDHDLGLSGTLRKLLNLPGLLSHHS